MGIHVPTLQDFEWQKAIIDKDLSAPPAASPGDRYIVATGGSGLWAGQDGKIAVYNESSTWEFVTRPEGTLIFVLDEDEFYKYVNGSWSLFGAGLTLGETFTLSCARNRSAADSQWLRGPNGVPLQYGSFLMPYGCVLTAMTASTRWNETWDAEIYKNNDITVGAPTQGNRIAYLDINATDEYYDNTLSVSLSAGDKIAVYLRGNNISYPHVQLYFQRVI
jgi:hypothetical protein